MRFIEGENLIPRSIEISDLFFDVFLPEANSDFVKIYIYLYYLSKRKLSYTAEEIANILHINIDTIFNAIDYWMHQGLIKKDDDVLIIFDLNSLLISNYNNENKSIEKNPEEDLIDQNKNPEVREFFSSCDFIIRRQTTPEEKKRILSWLREYYMDYDMILHAMSLAYDIRQIRNLDYVEGIIRRWYDAGLTTLDQVIEESDNEAGLSTVDLVMRLLNLSRKDITEPIRAMIETWTLEMGFSDEVISLACAQTVNIREPNVKYVDAVLKNWFKLGVNSIDDARKIIDDRSASHDKAKSSKVGSFDYTDERQTDGLSEDELKELLGWKGDL